MTVVRRGVLALLLTAAILVGFVGVTHWVMNIMIFTVMYAGLATGWNLVGGFAGYTSLGHAAFFGIGAYAMDVTFEHHSIGAGYLPFAILPLIGIAVAALSVPLGWIAMRTRAATFAIVTITLLFVVQTLAFNLKSITHGSQGMGITPPPFSLHTYERPFYVAMLAMLVLALLICWYVQRSKLGLALAAIRDDEDKAHGVGVHVTAVKLIAFSTSVALASMIGAVWAYYVLFIYPQFAVDPLISIGIVLMVFLGGKGTLWGPALGALIVVPAQQYFAYELGASKLYLIAYAGLFLVIMLFLPQGIIPSLTSWVDRNRHRRARNLPGGQLVSAPLHEVLP